VPEDGQDRQEHVELLKIVCRNTICTLAHLLVLYEHTFIHFEGEKRRV